MERCLYPSRRPGLLFYLCLIWLVLTLTSSRHSGGMLSFICAVGVMVANVSPLVPGAAWLKLDSQGFTARYWFKDTTYRWTDIKEFNVITYRYMAVIPIRRLVCFKLSESFGRRNAVVRLAGAIAQFDRTLPDNYGMKPKDLAALLELSRLQAVGVDANRTQVPWPAIEPK